MRFDLRGSHGQSKEHSKGNLVALLAQGIELEGTMKCASGTIRLDCHFKGEISCEGTIVVGDRGDVEANLQAKQISVAGKLKGNVHASERLELKEHGVLQGDVETPSLVIDPGAYFQGQCHMPTTGSENLTSHRPPMN
ncbi:MAG TPA: polymer-forming cytoskeletal protein [Terriglobia bacterium]|jgi:cytoskeletal protein CcmA (bactofilin family)|nr:polymer-forming cytoskeletal protein [Terriglobia bacterium]